MTWRTTYNAVDCGLFVMRHMEMYNGSGVWINNMKNEKEENKGKRLGVFIEEKGKEDKVDEDDPDIKRGRSTSTSISIEYIADHTRAKNKFFGKKSVVEPHPISIDEYNDLESDSKYTRIIKKTKVKRTVEEESVASKRKNMGKTMTDKKNGKMIVIEIYSESDEESSPVEKKEKIKMVLTEKYLKKKCKLVVEYSKLTKKDLRQKGKMVVPIDEDEELSDEDNREYFKSKKTSDQASVLNPEDDQLKKIIKKRNNLFFKSYIGGKKDDRYSIDAKVDFKSKDRGSEDDIWVDNGNFDEITVQDDVDKKTSEIKKIQCDKGYINEDLGFNFLSTGLEEIEYLIPRFEKQLENDLDVEPINNGIELVNNLTQIISPKVDILDMQIGLPSVVRNDDWQTSLESKCFYGIKLNDVDSNRKEYGIIDIWSLVLNHEEKYREKNSGGGNIYCYSGMLSDHLIESGADLIRRRSIFESKITVVLSQSPYKSFHDVDLVFFPMITTKRSHHFYLICFNMKTVEINIIDNLDNDIEDISVRYGELPIYL
ncbi:hypothetical protein Tco_1083641, partial [Tanacetum coccineum]